MSKIKKDTQWLINTPIAHRGLHDNKIAPENSLLAYKRAMDYGYNIELDVWMTKDGTLVLHHDPILTRTAGRNIKVKNIDTAHLENYKLFGTQEHIPTFDEMLNLIDGKIGLIIEIKPTAHPIKVCDAIMKRLQTYKGNYCIESFDVKVVNYMHMKYKNVILGQLYDYFPFQRLPAIWSLQHLKVDFMAICVKNIHWKKYAKIRKNFNNLIFITWTVRTKQQQQDAIKLCDNYIFESNLKDPTYIDLPNVTQ